MTGRRTRRAGAVVLAAVLPVLAACGGEATVVAPRADDLVELDTPALRSLRAEVGLDPCPGSDAAASGGGSASDLPAVTLPCLGGGEPVTLDSVAGPAVVTLWAQWCAPCRRELPWFQRLHEDAGADLTVLGVDYQDFAPEQALGLLRDSGVTFPSAADPAGELADHYRIIGLPGLLFVDEEGSVTFRNQAVSSYGELRDLVEEHTGVAPSAR